MNTKIFTLLSLSILSLLLAISMVSATATNFTVSANTLTFSDDTAQTITVDVLNSSASPITGNITITIESIDFVVTVNNTAITVTPATFDINNFDYGIEYSETFDVTSSDPETETITVIIKNDNVCSVANDGKLDISIADISVSGFGDDDEWFILDEIEVEVDVENKGNEDIEDVEIEWGLYDEENNEWAIEMDDIEEFDLDDDEEETITFDFILNEKALDIDLDELGDKYKLIVRAKGTIDGGVYEGDKTCAIDTEDVEVINDESDFVIVGNIDMPETVSCGSDLQIKAEVWNVGDDDQEDVVVVISDNVLGVLAEIEIGDVDAFESEDISTTVSIPESAEAGTYYIEFRVYDEDNDIYENDYDDDNSIVSYQIKIEGSCSSTPSVMIAASLDSEAVAGNEMIVISTITNLGSTIETFTIEVEGNDWAELVEVSPKTIVIGEGESKEATITLKINKGVSGNQEFIINAITSDGQIISQSAQVSIEDSGKFFSGITGNAFGGDNTYLWIIGALNVILVVIIIIVAIRVARK